MHFFLEKSCIAFCSWFCVRSSDVINHVCSFPAFLRHSLSQSHIPTPIQFMQHTHIQSAPLLHHVLLHGPIIHTHTQGVRGVCICSALISLLLCVFCRLAVGETRSPRPDGGNFDVSHPDAAYTRPPDPKH